MQQEAERSKFIVVKAEQEKQANIIRAEGEAQVRGLIPPHTPSSIPIPIPTSTSASTSASPSPTPLPNPNPNLDSNPNPGPNPSPNPSPSPTPKQAAQLVSDALVASPALVELRRLETVRVGLGLGVGLG